MKTPNLLTVTVIAAGYVVVSQMALAQAGIDNVDRMLANQLVNHHPMAVTDARAQPYVSASLHYTHLSEDELLGFDMHYSHGAVGQLGMDLAVSPGLMLNGFISYADVSPDSRLNKIGKANIDPMTIGGGITYRF
ncbi:OmpW family outer membrane protein [Halomonas sp.]|uniref:OmpW family outer membrane protein n=1 Tax=Halomonas sp. TaxID=1486246 RepID=UPI00384ABD20